MAVCAGGWLMPALSFHHEWLDPLLLGEKKQTTRPQNTRFSVGDTAHIYIEQRRRIIDKPLRRMTYAGIDMVHDRGYPFIPEFHKAVYHAHFLGKVEITEVHDIHFCDFTPAELEVWALADGFPDTTSAETWFLNQHGCDYSDDPYTVIKWLDWRERYFQPGDVVL